MIILDLLKFFARIPAREGVLSAFSNGSSNYSEYNELYNYVADLPAPLVPDIKHLVFGSSLESVIGRVNKVSDIYLFVDFGEFHSSRDNENNIEDTHRMAVTVAMKKSNCNDIIEEAIASDKTLDLLNKVRAILLADSENRRWMEMLSDGHSIVPFDNNELTSIGWTLIFDVSAADWFHLKEEKLSFQRNP